MSIQLDRFGQAQFYIAPIVENFCVLPNGRRIDFNNTEDGWYQIQESDNIDIIRKATQLEVYRALSHRKTYRVYPSGDEGFPVSFDQLFTRGIAQTIRVYFMEQPTYTVVIAKKWYDNRLYYFELDPKFQRKLLQDIKNTEESKVLDLPGITPEIKFYHLFLTINSTTKELTQLFGNFDTSIANRTEKARKADVEKILTESMARAGVRLIKLKKVGKNYQVTWRTGGQDVITNIDKDLRVRSAGFCLSGDDKLHTLETLVYTAKRFQNDEGRNLYITRH